MPSPRRSHGVATRNWGFNSGRDGLGRYNRLSRLPHEILAQILSLVPAQEAVQTCILGRTWRAVWKITTRLHITAAADYLHEVEGFVDGLLGARLDCAPLHACEITVDPFEIDDEDDVFVCFGDEDTAMVNAWIPRVLECKVKTLRVDIKARCYCHAYVDLDAPLASLHLARLELIGVEFICTSCLDLSCCPALEYLEISESRFYCHEKMASPSLKCLVIKSFYVLEPDHDTINVCVPRLVSLWLEVTGWTPLLDRMPDLVRAHVEFDVSQLYFFTSFDIKSARNAARRCFVAGLAEAKHMVMIATESTKIFTSDFRWCPTFSKLKTLVVHDNLCEPADCIVPCILEHAPVLEKFTFVFSPQFFGGDYKLEVKGCLDETVKSTKILQYLKIVEVKCDMVDERVRNILKFFGFQIRVTEK